MRVRVLFLQLLLTIKIEEHLVDRQESLIFSA